MLGVITFVWILYGMIRSTRITLAHCNVVVCITYRAVYCILAKSGSLGPKDLAWGLAESILGVITFAWILYVTIGSTWIALLHCTDLICIAY